MAVLCFEAAERCVSAKGQTLNPVTCLLWCHTQGSERGSELELRGFLRQVAHPFERWFPQPCGSKQCSIACSSEQTLKLLSEEGSDGTIHILTAREWAF